MAPKYAEAVKVSLIPFSDQPVSEPALDQSGCQVAQFSLLSLLFLAAQHQRHSDTDKATGGGEHGQAQVGEQANRKFAQPAPGHNVPVADGQHL